MAIPEQSGRLVSRPISLICLYSPSGIILLFASSLCLIEGTNGRKKKPLSPDGSLRARIAHHHLLLCCEQETRVVKPFRVVTPAPQGLNTRRSREFLGSASKFFL